MKPSSAMALDSAGEISAARSDVNASPASAAAAMKFVRCVIFKQVSPVVLVLGLLRLGRLPLAFQCFFLRPVETHGHDKRTFRRWKPVGLLILAGRFIL